MRIEIKMPYNSNQAFNVERNLDSIKGLKKQYPNRIVNSIYYDNLNFRLAKDNIDGLTKRCKIRARSYGNLQINQFNIEIKKKINKFGFKKIISLKNNTDNIDFKELFTFKNQLYKSLVKDPFVEKFITQDYLQPIININYSREYFIFEKIRLTHDKRITYTPWGNLKSVTQKKVIDNFNVLEIKLDIDNQNDVKNILEKINLKPKRFSKYVRGLSFFNAAIYL